MNFFKIILLPLICSIAIFKHENLDAMLEDFLAQFKRPVTVLEITDTQQFYTFSCAERHKGVFVLLSQAEKIDSIKKKVQEYNNIVLVHPKEFSTSSLVQLASCEHFDVTLVHDWSALQKNPYILSALLGLGDYLIIEVPYGFAERYIAEDLKDKIFCREGHSFGKERIYFKNLKRSLGKARWYMTASAQARQPSYTIVSNFTEKKLVKGAHKKTSDWVPGINLVTAIMLNVVYPNNAILRANIKRFREIDHNDPVMGNMIVQGERVVLIDFADSRRNADQEQCINAALKLLTWMHRPKDPYTAMQKYSEYVHG
jgi:hypothetical protein